MKYVQGGYEKHSNLRFISEDGSPFLEKSFDLRDTLENIKQYILAFCQDDDVRKTMFLPTDYKETTPSNSFVHPYQENSHDYCKEQYESFDQEVKEYLISLECIVAFIYDKSPIRNLAANTTPRKLKKKYLANYLSVKQILLTN